MITQPDCSTESMAAELDRSGHYRVLRLFAPPRDYGNASFRSRASGIIVDTETTGLDSTQDSIIELATLPFEFDRSDGRIGLVGDCVKFFEDPGIPIPQEITTLTGITDEMVNGKRIDDGIVSGLLETADLVIAHNAFFDRRFLERRIAKFANVPWACSLEEVPWKTLGFSSTSLEYLMFKGCSLFFEAHSAEEDCRAVLHLLATPLSSGQTPMQILLQSFAKKTVRIWATNAPYDRKEALKARKYRWNNGDDGRPKAWYLDAQEDIVAEEVRWLQESVYRGVAHGWKTEEIDARRRYSGR